MNSQSNRITSIEAARGLAIFCIIIVHTAPFLRLIGDKDGWYYLGHVLQQITSFAVPFFFIVSGYFYSLAVARKGLAHQLKGYLPRLLFLLVVWVIMNGMLYGEWLGDIINQKSLAPLLQNLMALPGYALSRPDVFLYWGTAVPLWFLFSLIEGILVLSVLIALRLNKTGILAVGALAYLFVLSTSVYSNSFWGLGFTIPFQQRGFFISLFFLSLGYFLSQTETQFNGKRLIAIAVVLMFAESFYASANEGKLFYEHPYIFSTALFAAALLIAAIQNPNYPADSLLYKIGTISLGIYLVHPVVIGGLDYFGNMTTHPLWELSYPVWTLLVSTGIVLAFQRLPLLRKIVS